MSQEDICNEIERQLHKAKALLKRAERPDGTFDMTLVRRAWVQTDMAEYRLNDVGGKDGRVRFPRAD